MHEAYWTQVAVRKIAGGEVRAFETNTKIEENPFRWVHGYRAAIFPDGVNEPKFETPTAYAPSHRKLEAITVAMDEAVATSKAVAKAMIG